MAPHAIELLKSCKVIGLGAVELLNSDVFMKWSSAVVVLDIAADEDADRAVPGILGALVLVVP
jgi:hypothetical protein